VLDATGKPVAQARVYFTSAPGPVPDIAAVTGADGRFRLTAPRPGAYQIAANTDALGSGRAEAVVGSKDVTLEIRLAR
jgi:protocatechuate 3,4-dioxygenase beta subunit